MCGSVTGTAAAPASEMQPRYVYEHAHLQLSHVREHAPSHPAPRLGELVLLLRAAHVYVLTIIRSNVHVYVRRSCGGGAAHVAHDACRIE